MNGRPGPIGTPERLAALLCLVTIPTIVALIIALAGPAGGG